MPSTPRRKHTTALRPKYDFSSAERGKHHRDHPADTLAVLLDPDVAAAFPDSESVNRALRLLMDLAKSSVAPTPSAAPSPPAPKVPHPAKKRAPGEKSSG